jgi:hypothetical protein
MIQIITLIDENNRAISRGRGIYDTVSDGPGTFNYNGKTVKAVFRNKTKNGRNFVLVTNFDGYDSFIIDSNNNMYGELKGLFYNSKYGISVIGFDNPDSKNDIDCQNLLEN